MLLWIFPAICLGFLGYVRVAPSSAGRWHVAPKFTTDKDFPGGVVRLVEAGTDGLARFDALVQATPRTTVLAGTVDEGMLTYVTRSAVIGFPDYTTVLQNGDQLTIYARLRFGRSDFGVNHTRIKRWVDALQAR